MGHLIFLFHKLYKYNSWSKFNTSFIIWNTLNLILWNDYNFNWKWFLLIKIIIRNLANSLELIFITF